MAGRIILDEHLQTLNKELVNIKDLVVASLNALDELLENRDIGQANSIIEADSLINKKAIETEELAYKVIALQAPVSDDLRYIVTSVRAVTDLERAGDHVKHTARSIRTAIKRDLELPTQLFSEIISLSVERLNSAMTAYVEQDVELARNVALADEKIDQLSRQLRREMVKYLDEDLDEEVNIKATMKLYVAANNLERIGDYTTNLCEWAVYLATGQLTELAYNENEEEH